LSRGQGEAAPEMVSWAPLLCRFQVGCVGVACRTRRAVRLIFACWLPAGRAVRLERFWWSRGRAWHPVRGEKPLLLIASSQVALRAAASSSVPGPGAVGGVDAGWRRADLLVVPRSRRLVAGAWEESTWSTHSEASMNDVDTDEHRQMIAVEERPRRLAPPLG
jgi:hypothetical protein